MIPDPVIIGFTGPIGAGKDAACDALVQRRGFIKIAFADPIRSMMVALNPIINHRMVFDRSEPVRYNEILQSVGYNRAKREFPEVRTLMQRLGTEAGRDILGEDVWTNHLEAEILRLHDESYTTGVRVRICIPDLRFVNELEFIESWNGRSVFVTGRADFKGLESDHASEGAIDIDMTNDCISNHGSIDMLANEAVLLANRLIDKMATS